jgi:hypothetical protein
MRQPFGERFPDSPQRRQDHDDHSCEQTDVGRRGDRQARLGVLRPGPTAPKGQYTLLLTSEFALDALAGVR